MKKLIPVALLAGMLVVPALTVRAAESPEGTTPAATTTTKKHHRHGKYHKKMAKKSASETPAAGSTQVK